MGGLFRHVLDLAAAQAERGHDVGIFADSTAENALTRSKFAAIAPLLTLGVERVPMSRKPGIGDISAAAKVRRHAQKLNVDVLHGHGAKGGAYARLAGASLWLRGRDVKSFYTPHGGTLNHKPGSLEQRGLFFAERVLEYVTDGMIFESAYAANLYRQKVNSSGAPERIIPNGLKLADFKQITPMRDATDLLFVGELRDLKGVDLLLAALADLSPQNLTATIVGSGPDGDKLKAMATELGLDGRVRFTGALPAYDAFALGRIMVVPSRAESFPYIVLEAAAAGLPLIATNVGGIPEIVAGTDTALVAPDNVPALTAALREILATPELARAKSARLRDAIARKFTVAAMTTGVLNFYTSPTPQD
ncbi:glycosyltransferase family 4 protein [Hyphomicrobium methylovorum]|uniref:glycosyltransferase family 4 protein n=1 Tax=Hyphomicrobium methylovorum TaxID=84 RepID=UPI0031B59118